MSVMTETALLSRCEAIEGLTFSQLAARYALLLPNHPLQRKGWLGMAIERALGADAGNRALPDFVDLGIELKTLPINAMGKPAESTFVTSIPLLTIHQQTWKTSQCYQKLKRVLWVPVEGENHLAYAHRRIGRAFLWSPSVEEEAILEQDWQMLSTLICTGYLADIHAGLGDYLQVRPKAASGKSLCYGYDEQGQKVLTLPRGFYLRSQFTARILIDTPAS